MRIEHVAMYVSHLEEARDFFVKYLGAKSNDGYRNPRTGFRSYFLTFDDGTRLELMNKPTMIDEQSAERTGYAHIAFSVRKQRSGGYTGRPGCGQMATRWSADREQPETATTKAVS